VAVVENTTGGDGCRRGVLAALRADLARRADRGTLFIKMIYIIYSTRKMSMARPILAPVLAFALVLSAAGLAACGS
jgi:hypothetical protein